MTTVSVEPGLIRGGPSGPGFSRQTKADNIRFGKLVILVNAAVPAALLLRDWLQHRVGPDPVTLVVHTTGMLTLIFLALTLLVTPLRKLTGFTWLFHFRRILGLYAFFYGVSHFLSFFGLQEGFGLQRTFDEMLMRRYLLIGSLGLLCMAPLAATSFNAVIKRMGAKRWQLLHKLVYVSAAAGALHFYMSTKADKRLPWVFIGIMSALLAYRLVVWLVARAAQKPAATSEAAAAAADPRWMGKLRVERITQETPNVRTFRLRPVGTLGNGLPFSYFPGQHLSLTLPIDGRKVRRSYTIASAPTLAGCCELTIKREEMGAGSRHMHALKEGDELDVTAPGGTFVFTGEAAHMQERVRAVALLAGGVGITPLMSMVRYLTARNWPGEIYLLYANRTESDIIFRRELEQLAGQHKNLHVVLTLTRADAAWAGRRGRIDEHLIREVVPDVAATPFYICGPEPMIDEMVGLLRGIGVAQEHILKESFGGGGAAVEVGGATHRVTFARSGKLGEVPANQVLLEAADVLRVEVDYECRSGICGRCRCRMLSGTVSMKTAEALTEEDRRENVILLCQARALTDVVVEA